MSWKPTFLGFFVALLLWPSIGVAQQGTPKRLPLLNSLPALKAQSEYRAASEAAREVYASALDLALKGAMASGDLPEANAINNVKKVLDLNGVPPKTEFKSPRAIQAASTYDASMTKVTAQFNTVLQAEQRAALAKGDLNEANALQETIKTVNDTPSKAPSPSSGELFETPDMVLSGKGFTVAALENNAAAFSNRNFVWKGVPANLQGWRYTKANGGGHPAIKVRAKQNIDVQVFTDVTTDAKVDLAGWERTGTQFSYTNGKNSKVVVFRKKVGAGQEIEIPQGNWAGVLVLFPNK